MSVTLVHDFNTEICTVEDICPRVNVVTRFIENGLVEVETVEVESHGGDTESSEPNANNRPSCKEEVKATRVVEGSILEDKTTEVSMCCGDGISLILLTEEITVVERVRTRGFSKERGSDKRTMHSREERATEDTSNTKDMERMHKDLVFSLKDKHEVEGTLNPKRHTIGERALTDRIDDEDSCGSGDRSGESNEDPWTHTKTIREFPFTTHPAANAEKEVKNNELISATVVKPFIETKRFPKRIEVNTNSIGRRNDSTRDDVVTVDERTCDRLTNTINIDSRCEEESSDVSDSSKRKKWKDKETEPSNVKTVRG